MTEEFDFSYSTDLSLVAIVYSYSKITILGIHIPIKLNSMNETQWVHWINKRQENSENDVMTLLLTWVNCLFPAVQSFSLSYSVCKCKYLVTARHNTNMRTWAACQNSWLLVHMIFKNLLLLNYLRKLIYHSIYFMRSITDLMLKI